MADKATITLEVAPEASQPVKVVKVERKPVIKRVLKKPRGYGRGYQRAYVRDYERSYAPLLKPRYPERGLPEISDLPDYAW